MFPGDLPIVDKPLPRFLDDAAAAKLLRAARSRCRSAVPADRRTAGPHRDPPRRAARPHRRRRRPDRIRLLAADPDRQAAQRPLHPAAPTARSNCSTTGSPTTDPPACAPIAFCSNTIDRSAATASPRRYAVLADAAGIGHVTAHQLRHTLATQAINRGMSLDAIAALLGHKTLAMTMIYARIADKTVADEYFAVTEKVEALYDQPRQLASRRRGPRDAQAPRRDAPAHARQRLLRPTGRDGLPLRVHLRILHLLRHHHRVPAHPASANATTPPARAKSAARRSSTASSTASTPVRRDRRP